MDLKIAGKKAIMAGGSAGMGRVVPMPPLFSKPLGIDPRHFLMSRANGTHARESQCEL